MATTNCPSHATTILPGRAGEQIAELRKLGLKAKAWLDQEEWAPEDEPDLEPEYLELLRLCRSLTTEKGGGK